MKLDKHVVDMFTELTKPADDVKMEKTCYGTISVVDGTRYVKLDGSDLLVPAASTVKTSHGDRVTVLMKNHSLTVTGNLTAPATDGEGGSSGEAGTAATIEVGTVTTGEAGSSASVTNSGTTSAAVFDFVIPKGDKGEKGDPGPQGPQGEKGDTGTWDGTIPEHTHGVTDITDFPESLPANGGNADTAKSVESETGKAKLHEVNEGGQLLLTSPDGTKLVGIDMYANDRFRMFFINNGVIDNAPFNFDFSTGLFNIRGSITNADKLDGFHASDFALKTETELRFQTLCPTNIFLYDDLNSPSVMVKIPKMTWAQLGVGDSTEVFPAFIVNGQVVDALYFPKYENIVQNNRGYSLPARDPAVYVDYDQSIAYSTAKGIGWHSMTRLEWCVIALWCLQNGFQPNGNNNFGKDISESTYKAIPTVFNADGTPERVATGTGPLTWSHNNAPDGIYDLNGNVWEWTTGVRSVYGELQVLSHDGVTFGNDAAHPANSQAADSALWRAIDGTTGVLITPDGSGTTANSLKLDFTSSGWKWVTGTISSKQNSYRYAKFESITVDSTVCVAAQRILQALCLYRANDTVGAYKNVGFWHLNGSAETLFIAGGHWADSVNAGVFGGSCCDSRSRLDRIIGFRSAFVNLPTT